MSTVHLWASHFLFTLWPWFFHAERNQPLWVCPHQKPPVGFVWVCPGSLRTLNSHTWSTWSCLQGCGNVSRTIWALHYCTRCNCLICSFLASGNYLEGHVALLHNRMPLMCSIDPLTEMTLYGCGVVQMEFPPWIHRYHFLRFHPNRCHASCMPSPTNWDRLWKYTTAYMIAKPPKVIPFIQDCFHFSPFLREWRTSWVLSSTVRTV